MAMAKNRRRIAGNQADGKQSDSPPISIARALGEPDEPPAITPLPPVVPLVRIADVGESGIRLRARQVLAHLTVAAHIAAREISSTPEIEAYARDLIDHVWAQVNRGSFKRYRLVVFLLAIDAAASSGNRTPMPTLEKTRFDVFMAYYYFRSETREEWPSRANETVAAAIDAWPDSQRGRKK